MTSFVWMKVLESAPQRYDRGIRMLSAGRIAGVYERIADLVAAPGKRILDVGCGTGGVTLACAARGATAIGIDVDAGMLEVAKSRPVPDSGSAEFVQLSAAEIEDRFPAGSLDAVVSCLAMSEMSSEEQDYVLRVVHSRLVAGGALVVADETAPEGVMANLAYRLRRLPVAATTYLLTQTTTRPLHGLGPRVQKAGFSIVSTEPMWSGSFLIVHAVKVAP